MRATALMIAALLPLTAAAHPGGLAADGCHNDRKNGGRHCHRPPGVRAPPAERPQRQQRLSGAGSYFANCSAARAGGGAPVRRGEIGCASWWERVCSDVLISVVGDHIKKK